MKNPFTPSFSQVSLQMTGHGEILAKICQSIAGKVWGEVWLPFLFTAI